MFSERYLIGVKVRKAIVYLLLLVLSLTFLQLI